MNAMLKIIMTPYDDKLRRLELFAYHYSTRRNTTSYKGLLDAYYVSAERWHTSRPAGSSHVCPPSLSPRSNHKEG